MAYKNFKLTEIVEELGSELRKIRISKGHSISFVAGALTHSGFQISNTLLGRIENGERRIDDDTLKSLCDFYQVAPSSVVIAASREHIREISEQYKDERTLTDSLESRERLFELYRNLNAEGQKEVSSLMRLMAYMEAFKKLS